MDSFAALKRRTTELISSLPEHLPAMPSVSLPKPHQHVPKGTWERIDVPSLPRSSHSIDIVAGTAYIFGGEGANAREPVDNSIHAIKLPNSGAGLPADYYVIPAKSTRGGNGKGKEKAGDGDEQGSGEVPIARFGHATAVIGSRIFMFGGRGGVKMTETLDEKGRVWVFDTKSETWSFLDPVSPIKPDLQGKAPTYAPARSFHSAVATPKPNTFGEKRVHPHQGGGGKNLSRAESWKEWVQGDSAEVGIPQRPIVGHIAEGAKDEDEEGYGTFIIHGGCLSGGGRASDTWAFDVRSRVWQELPSAPGKARGGVSFCVSKSQLYRFGGYNGQSEEGGELDVLDLVVDTFDDQVTGGEEATVSARGTWKTLVQADAEAPSTNEDESHMPLAQRQGPGDVWPGPRSVASMAALSVGGGREYIVLMLGERDPSNNGHAAAGKFWDDVWVFQVPPQGMSAASLSDAVVGAVGGKTGEGKWMQVETRPYDEEDDKSALGPGPRGWVASAPMGELEENGIVVWGGLDAENKRLGDGWIFRLD